MFGFVSKLLSGNQQPRRKANFRPQMEALEAREVMTVVSPLPITGPRPISIGYTPPAPTAAGLALINGLPNATVRSTALADYQRDGQLTRNDMLDVFFSATNDYTYLLAGAQSSVQSLVSNGPTVAMPDYVDYLSGKVLSGVSGLGLAPAQTINQHVNTFFLGLTHPDPGQYPTYTNPNKVVAATYQQVNEPLWNATKGPSYLDVTYTGNNGDATLISSIREVAYRNSADIMRMFIVNGDGTYTVRLYNGTTHNADYVTVDSALPFKASNVVDSHGNSVGQVPVGGAQTQPYLWVGLLEKAYAQENGLAYTGLAAVGTAQVWSEFDNLPIQSSTTMSATTIASVWSSGSFEILKGNGVTANTSTSAPFTFSGDFIITGVPTASANWFSVRRVQDSGYIVEVAPSDLAKFFSSYYDVAI